MKYNLTVEQEKKVKELQQMSPQQWDLICKRCGLCCLCKVCFGGKNDKDTYYTTVHCDALNPVTKQCNIYEKRLKKKGNKCKKLDIKIILDGELVPRTCGYVEYIFGPAPEKIFIDWRTVKPEKQVDLNDPIKVIQNLILESKNWNKR
ncbi:MAG: hypothetical protein II208_03920 [Alphaproteobacteria bacterium]|nr:hypothetical protein [Alphaproteobacteria bacterium]